MTNTANTAGMVQSPSFAPQNATRSGFLQEILDGYLNTLSPISSSDIMNQAKIQPIISDYVETANLSLQLRNASSVRGDKMKLITELPNFAVASFIARTHETALITSPMDPDGMLVTKQYDANGNFTGVWTPSYPKQESCPVSRLIYSLRNYEAKRSEVSDIFSALKNKCASSPDPRDHRFEGYPNLLIPFYNGVFDGKNHSFTEYNDPDFEHKYGMYIFTNKLDTSYNPNAQCPAGFDPIAFIKSLFDDSPKGKASARVLLQMFQFALRRYSGKEGHIIFMNNVGGRAAGHSGKSTVMDLLSFIIQHNSVGGFDASQCGKDLYSYGSKVLRVPLDQWGDRFALGADIRTTWVLMSDEASNTNYVENTGIIKNIARRQPYHYDFKFGKPFEYAFPGIAIHAQNDYVQLATKDDASFTHRIDLSFEKDFSGANGNKDIKNKWICDEEVAEYLCKVLCEMDFADDYDEADLALLQSNTDDVKNANIPTYRFCEDVLPGLRMKRIPMALLYTLYRNWFSNEGIAGKELSAMKFGKDVKSWINAHPDDWDYEDLENPSALSVQEVSDAAGEYHPALLDCGMNIRTGKIAVSCIDIHDVPGASRPTGTISDRALRDIRSRIFIIQKGYVLPTQVQTVA